MPALCFLLCLLLPLSTCSVHHHYTLAPSKNEGYWHEMPVPVRNHLNHTGGATRFWRQSLRHPSNTFHAIAGLPLDHFSIGVWIKTDPQFWQLFPSGVFWELACSNCGDPQATWSQKDYAQLRQQQQQELTAAAASNDCPIHIRLEATPQQTVVRTVAPEHQQLSTCAPISQQVQIINGIKSLNDDLWHHVVVVFDTRTTSSSHRMEVWVDGILDGTVQGTQNEALLAGRVASELTGKSWGVVPPKQQQ